MNRRYTNKIGISLLSTLLLIGPVIKPAQADHGERADNTDNANNVLVPLVVGVVLGSVLYHGHGHRYQYSKHSYGNYSGYRRHGYSHRGYGRSGYGHRSRSSSYGGYSRRSGYGGYENKPNPRHQSKPRH